MQVNEVTIFKLIVFTVCVVIITLLVLKINVLSTDNMCATLIVKDDVKSSGVSEVCPEGYYQNYGKFSDVKDGMRCCVLYEERI